MLDMNIKTSYKDILHMPEMLIIIILTICCLLDIQLAKEVKVSLIIILLKVVLIIIMCIRIIWYINFVKNGKICIGKVKEILIYRWFMVISVEYTDDFTNKVYQYKAFICAPIYALQMKKYTKKHSEIYIVVNKYMPKYGKILYRDYLRTKKREIIEYWKKNQLQD